MAKLNCFSLLIWNKKKDKGDDGSSNAGKQKEGIRTLQIKLEQLLRPIDSDDSKSKTLTVHIPVGLREDSVRNVKVVSQGSSIRSEVAEATYEAEDEHEGHPSIKRDFSAIDPQYEEVDFKTKIMPSPDSFQAEKEVEKAVEMRESGHISDPGISRAEFRASPKLKRSCSNLEAREVQRKVDKSFEESQGVPSSPASVMTHCSADRVIHQNLHKLWTTKPAWHLTVSASPNQHCGYSSDTFEVHQARKISKMESPGSFTVGTLNKDFSGHCDDNTSWNGFHNGLVSGLWPQKQWVALPATPSSMSRIDKWVRDLEIKITRPSDDVNGEEDATFPHNDKSPGRNTDHSPHRSDTDLSEAILHFNNVIQTLNSYSTVAHISGICLKAIPIITGFTRLRSVNLSNNSIGHITPGSLPKSLHSLNLSRNKINSIEGLRDLRRLRVLDLSYNCIARFGHGLSNCTLIKELYLVGNKMGDLEGLHRLLKLTLLDLSFNKITTTKALGHLVANYNSLQALNLLGNPIQSTISDDQLRKAVSSLLPKLTYLNKQPIKAQRGREVVSDSVAKAALGSGNWSPRRKTTKGGSHGGSTSPSMHKSSNNNRSKSPNRHHLSLMSPAQASPSL
ncbi:Outer arm dynein light chain 1 protein [Hibiscus syriacus]|uniref:Outer arm dynein light chain 1 protein n=1 Tax=Hibiscus syriacus TaxID=106335 RepID=A0A6A3BNB4_HIBSY|nr:Outer arm dynein light chain 1 protein [Hibiscus syriacus]